MALLTLLVLAFCTYFYPPFQFLERETFFFISIAGKQEEVPTVWEVFVVIVVCAALGWLIAVLFDHHRHA